MRRILMCLGIIAVVTSLSGCPWWGPHAVAPAAAT